MSRVKKGSGKESVNEGDRNLGIEDLEREGDSHECARSVNGEEISTEGWRKGWSK